VNKETEGPRFSALHFASFTGNLRLLNLMVENGANILAVNAYGINMMHVAAQGD
jgi:ankyrin repeat protein